MTEIPYEIELDEEQWQMLMEAISDGGAVTFTNRMLRMQMEVTTEE